MAAGDVTLIASEIFGSQNIQICTVEVPASYPAGGIALADLLIGVTPEPHPTGAGAKFGFITVNFVHIEMIELTATTTLIARYDRATDKIMLHEVGPAVSGPFAETDEDTTGVTELRCIAVGRLLPPTT